MQTTRSLRLLQPSRLDRQLHAFTTSSAGLSNAAYMLRDWGALPAVLREQISKAERAGCSWECWLDEGHTWLFIAQTASDFSREHGRHTVLRINWYQEDGLLHDTGCWASDGEQRWQRLKTA